MDIEPSDHSLHNKQRLAVVHSEKTFCTEFACQARIMFVFNQFTEWHYQISFSALSVRGLDLLIILSLDATRSKLGDLEIAESETDDDNKT